MGKEMVIQLQKNHIRCEKHATKIVKVVKMHIFSILRIQNAYKTQENVVQSHNCETVTFRKSEINPNGWRAVLYKGYY